MRYLAAITVLTALVVTIAAAPATRTAPAPATADAPADEYFGPFKYSALSVRTKIDALARSYNERWQDDASLVHDALMVESSYRVWAQRYPRDKWLAPTAYHLAQLYQEVQTPDARAHALAMYQYVAKAFPASKEAHNARLRLRQGLPPLHPESPVSPTPNPYAPTPTPTAEPTATPSPTPTATPTATPSPTPQPKRKRLF